MTTGTFNLDNIDLGSFDEGSAKTVTTDSFNLDNIDLGSFSTGDAKTVNDVVDDSISQLAKATQSVIGGENPDEYAKLLKLSRDAGLPVDAVKANPKQVETDLKLEQINFDQMSKRSPNTTKFVTDFDNAVLAQEDLTLMERIEGAFSFKKTFKNFGKTTALGFQKIGEGMMLYGVDRVRSQREEFGMRSLVPSSALPLHAAGAAEMMSMELATNLGFQSDEEMAQAEDDAIKAGIAAIQKIKGEQASLTPDDLNVLEEGVRGGAQSLVAWAPGFAATLLSGGRAAPMLLSAGAQTFAGSYAEGRSEGLSKDQSTFYATVDAGIEVLTELLPTKTLEGIFGGQFKGKITKGVLQFAVREMGTEQLATLGQSLNAYGHGLDEEMSNANSVSEMVDIQMRRQAVTAIATIVAGGAQAATFSGVAKTIEYMNTRNDNLETQGEKEQQFIDDINQMSTDSKLRERDAERFKQFIEKNDGDTGTQIHIDGVQLSLYLSQLEVEDDAAISMLRKYSNEAAQLGVDVTIPVAEFATYIAGSDHFTNLREFMSLSSEVEAPFRQEQAKADTQRYMETLVAQAQENVSEYAEAQDIFENVRSQLIDSGAYSARNADAMAKLVPAWATVYARDNGITIQEAYDRSGLNIVGPQTGRMEELQAGIVTPVEPSPEEVAARIKPVDEVQPAPVDFRREERRRDGARRERISTMSPEDQYKAIYGNELTGLNNRRAFEEDLPKATVVASIDADSLKTVNDNLGQDAGDDMLKIVGNALHAEFGADSYHISGDEFYVLGEDQARMDEGLAKVRQVLKGQTVKSKKGSFSGVDITYGFAGDKNAADTAMKASKLDREAKGERASRGEMLPGTLTMNTRDVELTEDAVDNSFEKVDASRFFDAITTAKKAHKKGAAVHTYTAAEYERMDLFLADEGKVGFAVKSDGNLVSVFKHPDSEYKKAIQQIVPLSLQSGAKKLDAFEGYLTQEYAKAGFVEVKREPWGEEFKPEGWTEDMGKPDVVFMEYRGQADDAVRFYQRATNKNVLAGAPTSANIPNRGTVELGIHQPAVDAAKAYTKSAGIPYTPITEYVKVDPVFAARIADEFDKMEHNPSDPEVKAAYDAMIDETIAQYKEILKTGLKVEFINFERDGDPYSNSPYEAVLDVVENNHLWVFSTRDGFGSNDAFDPVDNPLLRETEFEISGQNALANDVFRVVHDYFGHVKNGVGFRANGEENAWQSHAAMYSPLALRAMTTETRGQNSWLNFGPNGEKNRAAKTEDTVFADQKIGLLPTWVSETKIATGERFNQSIDKTETPEFKRWFKGSKVVDRNGNPLVVYHGSAKGGYVESVDIIAFDKSKIGDQFGQDTVGFFFTNDTKEASDYASFNSIGGRTDQGAVYPVYLSIKNPLIINSETAKKMRVDPPSTEGTVSYWDNNHPWILEEVAEGGHDGVILVDDEMIVGQQGHSLYVAFEPAQIKSINNRGSFNSRDPRLLYQSIGMYSAVERAVISAPLPAWKKEDGQANGADIWAKIKSMPNVKAEELKWIDLENFLTGSIKPLKFTRAQVVDYVKNNGVQVEEILAAGNSFDQGKWSEYNDETDDFEDVTVYVHDTGISIRESYDEYTLFDPDGNEVSTHTEWARAESAASRHAGRLGLNTGGVKWGEYVTAGDYTNYREYKLTLPQIDQKYVKASHFEDENIVAWMRVNDRKLDGKSSTFFLDELQSDWHQDGRQKGYSMGENVLELRKEYDSIGNEIDKTLDELFDKLQPLSPFVSSNTPPHMVQEPEIKYQHGDQFDWMTKREFSNKLRRYVLDPEGYERAGGETFTYIKSVADEHLDLKSLRDKSAEMDRIDAQIDAEISGVPDAPFKDDAWITMGLKRALILAAEGGYDSLAWPNAEVMMDRWSTASEDLYRNQYEKKMPSIIKKLTGETATQHAFRIGKDYEAGDMGYFIIPITPSLRHQITTNSFSLFQQSRGYYEPANSLIRLTEAANLSTFLHEFAHFMYEMELKSNNSSKVQGIHKWFASNAESVAKEANIYMDVEGDQFSQTVESRKQRARNMGFDVDTTYYHGTGGDITSFDLSLSGKETDHGIFGRGVYLINNPKLASFYATRASGNPNVIPMNVRLKNPLVVNGNVEILETSFHRVNDLLRAFKKENEQYEPDVRTYPILDRENIAEDFIEGDDADISDQITDLLVSFEYDGVIYDFGDGDKEIVVFDTSNVRSVNAEFRDSESSNILKQDITPTESDWLKPFGESRAIGGETLLFSDGDVQAYEADYKTSTSRSIRYVKLNTQGEIIGALQFHTRGPRSKKAVISNVYTHSSYRRQKVASSLLTKAREKFDIKHSEDLTNDGEGFAKADGVFYQNSTPDFTKPRPITADDVLSFLDVNTTGDAAKDAAIRRATHEHFARGFEAYLMEGKAPSMELRNIFATFARWLAQVYQSVRGNLRVNLDEDMRSVFDRMLATEEQLQAARARAQYAPMFNDAAMAGMTDDEFSKYQDKQQKLKDKESETLRDKLIKEITRQTTATWKAEKADIIDEQMINLRNEPVYRASESLRGENIKLDHATVKELYGEDFTDKLGRTSRRIPPKLKGMTVTGAKGVHPDEAAAFFGFNSGDEMVQEIIASPTIKQAAESNAEQEMLDRHGDMLNDGTIEQQADDALQSEERGELLLVELRTLARKHNTPTLDRQIIKTMAEENIAKLAFRQIHPGKYRKAEIRAAQESATMLAAGNTEGAMQAKGRQVMNYYLGMAATNAKNDTMKIVDRMARYNKKAVREAIMKAGEDYWSQIVKILNRFEFRKSATLGRVDQINEDVNSWMKSKIERDGDGLVLTAAVLNESYVTHWKNVPFADLKGIDDSVRNIEHVARYANKLTRMGEEIEFDKLVSNWVDKMNQQKTRFTAQRTDVVRGRNYGRWAMAQMTKIPYMASWLDGNERVGLSHQIMVQPFTDAYDAEIRLWNHVGNKVMKAIEGRDKATRKRHNKKIFIPAIKDATNDGNLFGHQIIAVALNTGNHGNLRKMLLGEGWANIDDDASITIENPKLQSVLSHMTKDDWDMVQMIWDQMEELYPQLAETHRRTTGLVPPKVEASPVKTPFGTFKGGYYPVKYDANRSHQASVNEDKMNAEVDSMFGSIGSIQASVNAGATNERTKYFAPIRLSLDVVPGHFQEVIHYITHHDAVREVNKLIRDKRVAETIKSKLGPEEYAQLRPWLNDIAKDGKEAPSKMFWDVILQKLRFGTTLGVIGFKASTGIIQISGLSNTIAEVGIAPVTNSVRTILGSPSKIKSAWDFANENSKVLNHRAKTMDREIKNAMSQLENKRGVLAAVQEVSMKHIALIQTYMVDLPSWYAGYIKAMGEHGDEQRAYQYADWLIENVQGSGATKDLARIMRGQAETARMFTMFMTFFSALWNLERDTVKGARSGAYSITNLAAKAMFLFTIPVIFEMLMRDEFGGEGDDGEDETLEKMLAKVAMFPVQSVPFLRDIVNATTGEYGYNISPIAALLEQGTRTIPEIVTRGFTDEEITEGQVKGATKFVGAAAGIPGTSQAWATGEHLYDVIVDGEDFTIRQLLFGPKKE